MARALQVAPLLREGRFDQIWNDLQALPRKGKGAVLDPEITHKLLAAYKEWSQKHAVIVSSNQEQINARISEIDLLASQTSTQGARCVAACEAAADQLQSVDALQQQIRALQEHVQKSSQLLQNLQQHAAQLASPCSPRAWAMAE